VSIIEVMPIRRELRLKVSNALRKISVLNLVLNKYKLQQHMCNFKSYKELHDMDISHIDNFFTNILSKSTKKSEYKFQRKVRGEEYTNSKKKWYNISADSKQRGVWDVVLLLSLMYILRSIPKIYTFGEELSIGTVVVEYLIDCIFIIDLIIQSFTINISEGVEIYDMRKNMQIYLKGSFFFDLVCSIPISWFLIGTTADSSLVVLSSTKQILRLIRILNIPKKLSAIFLKFNVHPITVKVIMTLIALYFSIHLIACAYWYVTVIEYGGTTKCAIGDSHCWNNYCICEPEQLENIILNTTDTSWYISHNPDTWVPNPYTSLYTLEHKYLIAFFWAITTITSVGINITPRSVLEYNFSSVVIILGVLFYAIIIANITTIMQSINIDEIENITKLDKIRSYLHKNKVNPIYYKNIVDVVEEKWKNDDPNLNVILTDNTSKENIQLIRKIIWRKLIYKYSALKLLDIQTFFYIVSNFKRYIYNEGDYICHRNHRGDEIYFIDTGKVDAVAIDGETVFYTIYPGEHFGEYCILNQGIVKRECAFRAVTNVSIHSLERAHFNSIIIHSPEFLSFFNILYEERKRCMTVDKLMLNKQLGTTTTMDNNSINTDMPGKKIFHIHKENPRRNSLFVFNAAGLSAKVEPEPIIVEGDKVEHKKFIKDAGEV